MGTCFLNIKGRLKNISEGKEMDSLKFRKEWWAEMKNFGASRRLLTDRLTDGLTDIYAVLHVPVNMKKKKRLGPSMRSWRTAVQTWDSFMQLV